MELSDDQAAALRRMRDGGLLVVGVRHYRGHPVAQVADEPDNPGAVGVRVYLDAPHEPVQLDERACGACSRVAEGPDAPDPCWGLLEGAWSGCCGHGDLDAAYLFTTGGEAHYGEDAHRIARELS